MSLHVALLRAVNLAGHNKVAMRDLVELVTDLGMRDARSLLQSGNLVFRSERAAGANAGPGAGMSRLSFRLRIKPGGPMGPMVDALMKPLMLPVAEELADRIMAELEKRHAPKQP